MTLLAHAGHWAGQLLYLAPVLAMAGAVAWGKLRGRGEEAGEEDAAEPLSGAPDPHR
jgi:hypothetical protein